MRVAAVRCVLLAVFAFGCSSAPPPEEPVDEPLTAGGEAEAPPPEAALPATTPVPVPAPAVPRQDLSEPLRQLWTQVEEAVAIAAPDGPLEASAEAVTAWAQGPFTDWLRLRAAVHQQIQQTSAAVGAEPAAERAVADALIAYALEDFAASIAGVPVPVEIARDAELLTIYAEALMDAVRPLARQSAATYGQCAQRVATLGEESPWVPWGAYCVTRGREVITTYGLLDGPADQPEGE